MEKINPIEVINKLKAGECITCPMCAEGVVSTEHDPAISHYFSCNKCTFTINID